jgi:uncharacterized membrane protein YgcG
VGRLATLAELLGSLDGEEQRLVVTRMRIVFSVIKCYHPHFAVSYDIVPSVRHDDLSERLREDNWHGRSYLHSMLTRSCNRQGVMDVTSGRNDAFTILCRWRWNQFTSGLLDIVSISAPLAVATGGKTMRKISAISVVALLAGALIAPGHEALARGSGGGGGRGGGFSGGGFHGGGFEGGFHGGASGRSFGGLMESIV